MFRVSFIERLHCTDNLVDWSVLCSLAPPLTGCIMCPHHMHVRMQGGNFCSSVGPHSHLQPAAQCGRVLDPASEGLQRDHLPHGACGALATGTTEGGTCGKGRGEEGRG